MDMIFFERIDKLERWIEKTLKVKMDDLKNARSYMYETFRDVFIVPNYNEVVRNSIKAKTVDELPTSIERCFKRCDDIHRLNELCESGKIYANNPKAKEKVATDRLLWHVLDNSVIIAEMVYLIECRVEQENTRYTDRLMNIYKYWKNICEMYLSKTEVYELILEDYKKKQENKPEI